MKIIARIRQKVRRGEYVASEHTLLDKLPLYAEYDWTIEDVERGLLTGEIFETLDNDFRGRRYVILGSDRNGYDIYIVCRFRADGNLFLITVYDNENYD